jgi:hypothetical protein
MAIEKTRLKFAESPQTGEIIGFVSRNSKTKLLRGVAEASHYGKKVCVLSADLKGAIEQGVLYDVELKPMRLGNGYVVVSAQRTLFEAEFETVAIPGTAYQIKITFGHKTIWFDPIGGKSASSTTVDGVLGVIASREDIFDKEAVMERFRCEAAALLAAMDRDGLS